ncbi:mRNA interferase [Planctomycetales bacterium]|nr:mRNA interferase [Planctomycetales bacterium]GHT07168.1 mRNA interferase [Planctomycetales bacterium]
MKQYDIYWVNLEPTVGHEIKKIRPAVIISPDEINRYLKTAIVAPLTTKFRALPTRVAVNVGGKNGWIMLDQIRTVDKQRLAARIGGLNGNNIREVKRIIQQLLVE